MPPRDTFALFALCSTFASPLIASAAPIMEEGNWEVTTKVEMPRMPMSIPPTTHR